MLGNNVSKWERCPTIHSGQGKLMIMMSGNQIITEGKEDGVYGMYRGKEECIQSFWWGNHLEDIGVDGKIIFKRIFKI